MWLVAEAPAAMAVSEAQEGVFRPGAMPALGTYLDLGPLAVGVRVRAGVLRDGPEPVGNVEDPALGGLLTGALALRGQWRGGWAEVTGGGGVTGSDWVPSFEAGAGWSVSVGALDIGPSMRYLRVVAASTMDTFGSAELALVGVDVRVGRERPKRRAAPVAAARPTPSAPAPEEAPAVVEPSARDLDQLVDREESCVEAMEGCLNLREVTVEGDRLILDELVLFDRGRARLHSRGRRIIRQIAALWLQHPEWRHLRVEGHTCDLGDAEENRVLSQRRAEQVRRVLMRRGVPGELIEAVGLGQTRPRDPGAGESARQRNRRVEFVIERGAPRAEPALELEPAS